MRTKLSGLFVVALLMAATASAQKVHVDYDRSAEFGVYKTFAWGKTPDTSLQGEAPLMHSRVKNSIEYHLTEGGLVEDTENPDGGGDRRHGPKSEPPNKLSAVERRRVLEIVTSPEIRQPPQILAIEHRDVVRLGRRSQAIDIGLDPRRNVLALLRRETDRTHEVSIVRGVNVDSQLVRLLCLNQIGFPVEQCGH